MYDAAIEGKTYNGDGNAESFDPEFFDKWSAAIAAYPAKSAVPMMVGEWGLAAPENPGLSPASLSRPSPPSRGLTSGWSHFNGCLGDGYCTLDENGEDRPGLNRIIQPYAVANAGALTSTRFTPADQMLRIEFDDNDATGTTDLVIPEASRYPDGWRVCRRGSVGNRCRNIHLGPATHLRS